MPKKISRQRLGDIVKGDFTKFIDAIDNLVKIRNQSNKRFQLDVNWTVHANDYTIIGVLGEDTAYPEAEGVIAQFKAGKISPDVFYQEMMKKLGLVRDGAPQLTIEQFYRAWNEMLDIGEHNIHDIAEQLRTGTGDLESDSNVVHIWKIITELDRAGYGSDIQIGKQQLSHTCFSITSIKLFNRELACSFFPDIRCCSTVIREVDGRFKKAVDRYFAALKRQETIVTLVKFGAGILAIVAVGSTVVLLAPQMFTMASLATAAKVGAGVGAVVAVGWGVKQAVDSLDYDQYFMDFRAKSPRS